MVSMIQDTCSSCTLLVSSIASLEPNARLSPRENFFCLLQALSRGTNSSTYIPQSYSQYLSVTRSSMASGLAPCLSMCSVRMEVNSCFLSSSRSFKLVFSSIPRSFRNFLIELLFPLSPLKYGSGSFKRLSNIVFFLRESILSSFINSRAIALVMKWSLYPRKPPRFCLSPTAPAKASDAKSQFSSSIVTARKNDMVAPHASLAPSNPNR